MHDLSTAPMDVSRYPALAFWLLLCFGVAFTGARWNRAEIQGWYKQIARPRFSPPNRVFPVVWTILYWMMGIAAWLISERAASQWRTLGLILFAVQLALNLAWSWIFFRRHAIGAAFAEIVVLWIAIGAATLVFSRVSPGAAWLMAPYWAWVSFAAVLNFSFWRLNR